MCTNHNLKGIVQELIELMRAEARELEKLVIHVEQVAGKLPDEPQFAALASQLTALKARMNS
jgi:hypothetical protein